MFSHGNLKDMNIPWLEKFLNWFIYDRKRPATLSKGPLREDIYIQKPCTKWNRCGWSCLISSPWLPYLLILFLCYYYYFFLFLIDYMPNPTQMFLDFILFFWFPNMNIKLSSLLPKLQDSSFPLVVKRGKKIAFGLERFAVTHLTVWKNYYLVLVYTKII